MIHSQVHKNDSGTPLSQGTCAVCVSLVAATVTYRKHSALRVDVIEISANEYPGLETVRPRNTKRPRK
jgi:hypothetical protein